MREARSCILVIAVVFRMLLAQEYGPQKQMRTNQNVPEETNGNSSVEVAVYYETLCIDSRHFIINQLLPSYLRGHQFVKPILIPYGKAETILTPNGFEFNCQHGQTECQGNKIHACAISIIEDKETELRFIECMIRNNTVPEAIGEECASKHNITWHPILQCSRGIEGNMLLKRYGDMTYAIDPSLIFVPTVTLNGSQGDQTAILNNLLQEVCAFIPWVGAEWLDRWPRIPVKVMVYYESQCPDSADFIVRQLLPTVLRAPEAVYPVLIPYGKATTHQKVVGYEFSCQHGETECIGNKLHACAIALTESRERQVKFVACAMSVFEDIEYNMEQCARELDIPWNTTFSCAFGETGSELLMAYGKITQNLKPKISFVPTVTLNEDRGNQTAILKDLWGEISLVIASGTQDTSIETVAQPYDCNTSGMHSVNCSLFLLSNVLLIILQQNN